MARDGGDEISRLLEQAERMQQEMQAIQSRLEKTEVVGEAGDDKVKVSVRISCKYVVPKGGVKIEWAPAALQELAGSFASSQDSKEIQQRLGEAMSKVSVFIADAIDRAARQIEAVVQKEVAALTQQSAAPAPQASKLNSDFRLPI